MELILGFVVLCIKLAFWFLVFFLISIPLHEISHFLFLVVSGANTNNVTIEFFTVSFDEFNFGGAVVVNGFFEFPEKYKGYKSLVAFLYGLSGGVGSAILLSSLLLLPLFFNIGVEIVLALLFAMGAEALYGIGEAYKSLTPEKMADLRFTRRTR